MLATLNDITSLMGATQDPDRLNQLIGQRATLLKQLGELVDKNLNQESDDYQAAVRGLQAASAQIQNAIKGLSAISNAISIIASALSLIEKIVTV